MALTLFIFKVSNLGISQTPKVEPKNENQDELTTESPPPQQFITDENTVLLTAKVSFRDVNLWSNNVPIRDGTANFVARGQKPSQFNFHLATMIMPDDKVRIEFETSTVKKKKKKVIAIFELMLESLMDTKYIDLPEENLSDPNNRILPATIQLKIYYTPPDIDKQNVALGIGGEGEIVDWKSVFDNQGRRGGHRSKHLDSKKDKGLKKIRRKIFDRSADGDTDSNSDSEFDGTEKHDGIYGPLSAEDKLKAQYTNLELLEKGLGRYEGNAYELTEWQIMVHIIQGRDLPGIDINPYVSVQIDDLKRYTIVHKCSNSPYFGQFFTFDFKLPATHVMEKIIYFKVFHARKLIGTLSDSKPLGIFQLDVATVYNEKGHAFERKWAQLINPEAIDSKCGHLLVSIAVTERGVPSTNVLGELGQDDDEFSKAKVLIPAAMPRRLFPVQIKIIFYSASEIPEMMTDFLSSVSKKIFAKAENSWEPVDPYVEVSYNSMQVTTAHCNGTTPFWGEGIYLIGRFPPLVRTIKITLKDYARVQQNRIISSFFIDLFTISESNPAAGFLPSLGPTWMFLYGSPREYTISKDNDGLSQGMGEAVCYKGKILMAIECHPVSGGTTSTMNVQKESGIQLPEAHIFPVKRKFLLFGCIYDVTMIDKSFGNSTICFELSIGPSGYLTPHQIAASMNKSEPSLTRPYPRLPVDNNKQHFRLPLDLQKPIVWTKYEFHDYAYRMTLSNRLKHASDHMYKLIREFESKVNSHVRNEVLMQDYRKMEEYIHALPCGCGERISADESLGASPVVHPTLLEVLNSSQPNLKMNVLDTKRRKKLLHNVESLKSWISKEIDFDDAKRFEAIKELSKIARAIGQMAFDVQPSLPDIFLWMICDSKRVAYARLQPEDLFFNVCDGDKGLQNGRVQTIFLKTPRTTDKPLKSATNAKVQIFLWLGIEEHEPYIFKQLPTGYEMPSLPLHTDIKNIRYNGRATYELRCHCYKARSLIASDETGLSDPYLSITIGNETQTTPVLIESLCPQWNITLAFQNLKHIGSRETAEEIIGNVVVECYDYDDSGDGPDLIGRFSTTAKLDLFNKDKPKKDYPFQWYEFKMGDKRAGELLAIFELIEVNPETGRIESEMQLEEIAKTTQNYDPAKYILKLTNNPTYQIPFAIMPPMKTYEIEIMFWGLRECRSINFQAIQQADVTIECAGERVKREIRDAQKFPNFDVAEGETNNYKLTVQLPDDNNFWPHLSILCVQNRYFGMTEVVGNLVVTDLKKYLEVPPAALTANNEALADAVNELSKRIPYDFNRVRRSVFDAYEAALTEKDKDVGKRKLDKFESEAGRGETTDDNKELISTAEQLLGEHDNEENNEPIGTGVKPADGLPGSNILTDGPIDDDINEHRPLTALEKAKRINMEKEAGWWNKYYASKARLRLAQREKFNPDDNMADSEEVYAEFFVDEPKMVIKSHVAFWNRTKKIFQNASKAQKKIKNLAGHLENLGENKKIKSFVDASLDEIETGRLKELTLLQTFDFVETELENVLDYEGFNDCLDTFPLYKGKGSSRSDEHGDDNRIYAKFKGKLRIQELQQITTDERRTTMQLNKNLRKSIHPLLITEPAMDMQKTSTPNILTSHQMRQFDMNKNPITLKCRLYVVKALLYRAWDPSGKADPFLKVCLNNTVIIDDIKGKILNSLEPTFGKSFEFEVQLPAQSILRVQIWDWDMTSSNDMIAETKIDLENRWFSCHRATCGLPKRYDSSGYNAWRDTKKPTQILTELCQRIDVNVPIYTKDFYSLAIQDQRFDCDPECIEFATSKKTAADLLYRKVHHELPEEYIRQNTALVALLGWGRKINPKSALVTEHIECRSLFNPQFPETEQGKLEMWVDFFPMSRPPTSTPLDITPPKPVAYQLRISILNTSDVELNDENFLTGEKTSDIYVKAWILGEKSDAQQTDVHYRSLTGEGNFNWRFIFNFNYLEIEEKIVYEAKDSIFQVGNTMKKIPPRVIIRVYDSDLLSADDFLGECILDLSHLPIGAKTTKKCKADMLIDPKYTAKNLFLHRRSNGWWPMIAPKKEGEIRDKALLGGKVEAEFMLVTAEEAEKNPVGREREPPQALPEPNRPKTSFLWFTSPWKTFRYVIWRNFKWTLLLAVVLFIFVIFLLLALWSLPGEFIKQISNKIFHTNSS